jgi:multidrug efflux pump subunit AcrA (membrane-fusion protein)
VKNRLNNFFTRLRSAETRNFVKKDIQKKPLTNFLLSLLIFILLIALSAQLQTVSDISESRENEAREVVLFEIGANPRVNVQARIEKTGVVTVSALSSGVVKKVNFREGEKILAGQTIIKLSTNYQGGNASFVQRKIAENQYKSIEDTFGLQKETIQKQKNLAIKNEENAEKLSDITGQSRGRTNEIIEINKTLLGLVNDDIEELNKNPDAEIEMISALQAQKAQLLAGLGQAENALRNADLMSDTDRPPAELAKIQKDLALQQLDIQEKMLVLNKEAAELQLELAGVIEATMYPSSPFSGIVERIFVDEGDLVSPGTQLAIISQDSKNQTGSLIAYVQKDLAENVSMTVPSVIKLFSKSYKVFPFFISTEAVLGNSYAVYYPIPEVLSDEVTDEGYVEIELSIGRVDVNNAEFFVPVDSIYQTSDTSFLFVEEKGEAKGKQIELGEIYGGFVEVKKGLARKDKVILSRNVVDGDKVRVAGKLGE